MRLLYRPAAIEDIERAADYIEHQLKNPSAAEKLKTTIVKKAALLKDNPEMGMKLSEKFDIESDYRFIIIHKQIFDFAFIRMDISVVQLFDCVHTGTSFSTTGYHRNRKSPEIF